MLKASVLLVTVCEASLVLVQTTIVPFLIVSTAGLKAYMPPLFSIICTLATAAGVVVVAVVGLGCAAAVAAVVGVG